jgi:hypothetical protein
MTMGSEKPASGKGAGGLLAGTRIATDGFPVRIESLKPGDLVQTLHGGLRPVAWIGQTDGGVECLVSVKANAVADYVPGRDLYVCAGHAVCVDGVLVPVGRLVNGVSIIQSAPMTACAGYHVGLDSHEVIFAENCPVESFRDEAQVACLERLESGFFLHALQVRLLEQAGGQVPEMEGPLAGYIDIITPGMISGWAKTVSWDEMVCGIEMPVCLDVFAGEHRVGRVLANLYRRDVQEAGYGTGHHGFEFLLPAGVQGPFSVRRSSDGADLALSETALAA